MKWIVTSEECPDPGEEVLGCHLDTGLVNLDFTYARKHFDVLTYEGRRRTDKWLGSSSLQCDPPFCWARIEDPNIVQAAEGPFLIPDKEEQP